MHRLGNPIKLFSIILTLNLWLNISPALAMMVSMENSQSSSVTSVNTSTVLVSKENEQYPVKFIVRQEQDSGRNVLVSWENAESHGTFIVRDEMDKDAGMAVHKPASLDMMILRIICQENIRSLADYAKWLDNNFTYQKHEGLDVWTSPEETLTRHSGDCKDFALLNTAFLRVLGYRPKIFAMARLFDSHAICVFEKSGHYLWFDNTKLKETPVSSIDELKNYIYDNHQMYYLYEVNLANLNQATACSGELRE
jgi:hypothetical protein